MMIKKGLSRSRSQLAVSLRLLLITTLLSLLTSCTTFIPGLDRILFANSSAKVGPLVEADEQYPADIEQKNSTASGSEAVVKPETAASKKIDSLEPETKAVVQIPEVDSSSANSAKVAKPLKTTVKTASSLKPKASDNLKPKAPESLKPKVSESLKPEASESLKPEASESLKPEASESIASEITVDKETKDIVVQYGAVSGKVVLIDEGEQLSAAETMVRLTPTVMMGEAQNRSSQVHVIDMEDKEYQPRYTTIQAGDKVVFVNKDNIQHNVFSSSGNNAFDLGTYGAGLKRAVTLKEPGIVKIYCNIHSDMATFVAVSNQGLSAKADTQGRYKIDNVPPGTYEVAIWNIRGETKRLVEVKADETTELVDRINTTAPKVEVHKNKFGGDYSKNSKLFEDEFY